MRGFITKLSVVVLALACLAASLADEKHMTVAMRMIGHELLLSSGDHNSRVLPVNLILNAYHISFSEELAIVPDSLLDVVSRVVDQYDIPEHYIVEVLSCDSNKVVYAYEVGTTASTTIQPCIGRSLPRSCYVVVFTDLTVEAISEENDTGMKGWTGLILSLLGLALALLAIFWYKRGLNQSKNNPNLIHLGKYSFDKLNSELIIEEQRIELTSKEADLLMLLYQTANTTVERDVLLNKVWGDEGDYIGRTLDVFISKLRKKLEFDTRVKIVNVRGVGYKLVLDIS